MADTLDKLTNLLALMKGVSGGVTPDGQGGGYISATGVLGGLGQSMQGNKNLEIERKAALQNLEIQKQQFEWEKENRKLQKELDQMKVAQAKTQHEGFKAQSQEEFRKFNQAQMKEVLRGERNPEDVQFAGDRFKPTRDAQGNLILQEDKTSQMLKKIQSGGLESVVKDQPFQKETEVQMPTRGMENVKTAGPIGLASGFIFKALNPFTKQLEDRSARIMPDPSDGSVLTEGLSLGQLENLRDLSIAKPEYFDQRAKDKIAMSLIERKKTDIAISEQNKAINAQALQMGMVTEEDVIADSQFSNTIAPYLPADLNMAKLEIKKAVLAGDMKGIFGGVNKFMAGAARNQFRQTEDWSTLQKVDIQESKSEAPMPGMGTPESVKLSNKSVADRRKYGVNKNASKPTK